MKTCGAKETLTIGTQSREMRTLQECAFLCSQGHSFAGTRLGSSLLRKGWIR